MDEEESGTGDMYVDALHLTFPVYQRTLNGRPRMNAISQAQKDAIDNPPRMEKCEKCHVLSPNIEAGWLIIAGREGFWCPKCRTCCGRPLDENGFCWKSRLRMIL